MSSTDASKRGDAFLITLAAMRIGIGGLAWVRPQLASKLFGLPAPDGQAGYPWRLFGASANWPLSVGRRRATRQRQGR